MKSISLFILAFIAIGFAPSQDPLTEAERDFAIYELIHSRDRLLETINGLSNDQLTYKLDENSWSIAECVEHIALSENITSRMLKDALQTEINTNKEIVATMLDEDILNVIKDRSSKIKTSSPFEPKNTFGSVEETIDTFKNKRQEHLDFVLNSQEDLRNRFIQMSFGTLDLYQLILFNSGHTDRHVAQIKEIMSAKGFPKK